MSIYCPNCENECSEKAPMCPKCGHPLRRVRRVSLLVLIALAVVVCVAVWGRLEREPARVLEQGTSMTIERLIIVDDKGRMRAEIGATDKFESALSFFDADGTRRASLGFSKNSRPFLSLFPKERHGPALGMHLSDDGQVYFGFGEKEGVGVAMIAGGERMPTLQLADGRGKVRMEMGLYGDGSPHIDLRDDEWKASVGLSMRSDGTPLISLTDASKKQRAALGLMKNGEPWIVLGDETEQARIALGTRKDGQARGINLLDAEGRVRLGLEVGDEGDATVRFLDEAGVFRGSLGHDGSGLMSLILADPAGRARCGLFLGPDGMGGLGFFPPGEGALQITLGLMATDTGAYFVTMNEDGELIPWGR